MAPSDRVALLSDMTPTQLHSRLRGLGGLRRDAAGGCARNSLEKARVLVAAESVASQSNSQAEKRKTESVHTSMDTTVHESSAIVFPLARLGAGGGGRFSTVNWRLERTS